MFKYPIISGDGGNSVLVLDDPGAGLTAAGWKWARLVTEKNHGVSWLIVIKWSDLKFIKSQHYKNWWIVPLSNLRLTPFGPRFHNWFGLHPILRCIGSARWETDGFCLSFQGYFGKSDWIANIVANGSKIFSFGLSSGDNGSSSVKCVSISSVRTFPRLLRSIGRILLGFQRCLTKLLGNWLVVARSWINFESLPTSTLYAGTVNHFIC